MRRVFQKIKNPPLILREVVLQFTVLTRERTGLSEIQKFHSGGWEYLRNDVLQDKLNEVERDLTWKRRLIGNMKFL